MECVSPPELDEKTLLKFLDGTADQAIARHLAICTYCRRRANDLRDVQARLAAGLYRATCPSSLELGEFHLRLLPSRQAAAVARHVAECPHCSREVANLDRYIHDLSPELEVSAVERLTVLVAKLISPGRAGGLIPGALPAPAYAGVRGNGEGVRTYQAGAVQISVTVQPDSRQPERQAMLGLITGFDGSPWQIDLWRGNERIAQDALDELGNFAFGGLDAGRYDLIVSGPDAEIHVRELDVGAA